MRSRKKLVFILLASIAVLVLGGWFLANKYPENRTGQTSVMPGKPTGEPTLKTEIIADGLSNVWDVAQAPDNTVFYTERSNKIGALLDGQSTTIHQPADTFVRGEGGMLGMALDPNFGRNRYLYACFNTSSDVRLVRFNVSQDNRSLGQRLDILTGLPSNPSGRHSGCRPRFDSEKFLLIGTGDAARKENSQNPDSLGGKILRIDRDGKAAPGNQSPPFDQRVYSYGHRNVQGLAFYRESKDGLIGYSVEHGPDRDDELNLIQKGNSGWEPGAGYDENVPMTDVNKFPDAFEAIWSSGRPTIAPSGATLLEHPSWKNWQGRLMMAVQKDKHVRLFSFDESGKKVMGNSKIIDNFGRVRSLVQGHAGEVYMTTDNGGGEDKIVKITPG